MLLLVRHANAGDKSRWQGPDSLRPLSSAGQAQAAGLVVRLEDYPSRASFPALPSAASRPCSFSPTTAACPSSPPRRWP
jgi:broad specificity phosphatase PhoE